MTAEATMVRLRERLASSGADEAGLRVMLVLAHEALRQRERADAAAAPSDESARMPKVVRGEQSTIDYSDVVARMGEVLRTRIPAGARILVVSKGDDALLPAGFDAAHFPQGPDGLYAGHYPADSASAIAHLEHCRAGGGDFLVLPAPAFWWLEYYAAWAQHLLLRAKIVHHDEHCLIFDLRDRPEGDSQS